MWAFSPFHTPVLCTFQTFKEQLKITLEKNHRNKKESNNGNNHGNNQESSNGNKWNGGPLLTVQLVGCLDTALAQFRIRRSLVGFLNFKLGALVAVDNIYVVLLLYSVW